MLTPPMKAPSGLVYNNVRGNLKCRITTRFLSLLSPSMDIVEVIYAIVESKGICVDEFEQVRVTKREDRGGFAKKLFLISVD